MRMPSQLAPLSPALLPDSPAKLPTIYLETTIVSYLTARSTRDALITHRQIITRRWWEEHRANYSCFASDVVRTEASDGDATAAQRRLNALAVAVEICSDERSRDLAAYLLRASRLPARAAMDAEHIAVAATHKVEILLTWNCAHLANPNIIPTIRRACEAYGYAPPDIYTPEQLIGVCAYGRPDS